MVRPIKIGLVGAGANTRTRHIPGFRAVEGVEIVAVCNRRPESTAAAAQALGAKAYGRWEDVVADPAIDAIVIGTWPYLHCPITLAALEAGKHVLTEARMAMNAQEARSMLAASADKPDLVCQIVPSPFGLRGDRLVRERIASGYIGELREATVFGMNFALGGPEQPLSWRQDAALSGYNMVKLGILHESLLRWAPPPVRVMAQVHAFIAHRTDPESGSRRLVGTPDSVQVLTTLQDGARAVYQFTGVTPVAHDLSITLRGSEGVLRYDFLADRITGLNRSEAAAGKTAMQEIAVPAEMAGGWRVEADFIDSIREQAPVRYTDFATGVSYMEFTEAVAKSAREGVAVMVRQTEQ